MTTAPLSALRRPGTSWPVRVRDSAASDASIDGAGGGAGWAGGDPTMAGSAAMSAAAVIDDVRASLRRVRSAAWAARPPLVRAALPRARSAVARDPATSPVTDAGHGGWRKHRHASRRVRAGPRRPVGGVPVTRCLAPTSPHAAPTLAPVQRSSEAGGAVLRAPSAAPEYVQTGRSGGPPRRRRSRESAVVRGPARRMLTERKRRWHLVRRAHPGDRSTVEPTSPRRASRTADHRVGRPVRRLERLGRGSAQDRYREARSRTVPGTIMVMMDVARARNGGSLSMTDTKPKKLPPPPNFLHPTGQRPGSSRLAASTTPSMTVVAQYNPKGAAIDRTVRSLAEEPAAQQVHRRRDPARVHRRGRPARWSRAVVRRLREPETARSSGRRA